MTHALITTLTLAQTSYSNSKHRVTLAEGTPEELAEIATQLMRHNMVDNLALERISGDIPPGDDQLAMWVQFALAHARHLEES